MATVHTRQYGSDARPLPPLCAAYLRSRESGKDSPHTTARLTNELRAVAAILSDGQAANLTVEHLTAAQLSDAFAAYAGPRSKSTVAGAWSTWNGFLLWLVRDGQLAGNPMDHIRRPKVPRPTPKSLAGGASTVDRLITSVRRGDRPARKPWPERDLAAVVLFAATGLRRDEAARLNVVDLDRGDSGAQLRVTGKGDKQRWTPAEPALVAILDAYQRTRVDRFPPKTRNDLPADDAPLLVNDQGGRFTGRQLYWLVQQCYRAAGVAGQVPRGAMVHALRHTFATLLAERGAAATDLQELLGHDSLSTSQRYVSVTGSRLRQVISMSPALLSADPDVP